MGFDDELWGLKRDRDDAIKYSDAKVVHHLRKKIREGIKYQEHPLEVEQWKMRKEQQVKTNASLLTIFGILLLIGLLVVLLTMLFVRIAQSQESAVFIQNPIREIVRYEEPPQIVQVFPKEVIVQNITNEKSLIKEKVILGQEKPCIKVESNKTYTITCEV